MSAKRTERLLALVLLLLGSRRPLTRAEIRDAVGEYGTGSETAFERAFERDKDELRSMGIPVETVEPGEYDEVQGYRIASSSAFLPPVELDPAERSAIALAARMWEQASLGPTAIRALRKLEAAGNFDADVTDNLLAVPAGDAPALEPLIEAAAMGRPVKFDYRASGQRGVAARFVDPWGLVAARGSWYLAGHDRDRRAVRVFRLSRIEGLPALAGPPGSVQVPDDIDIRALVTTLPGGTGSAQTLTARVAICPGAAASLRLRAEAITRQTGRAADFDVAEIRFSELDRMTADVLRAGDQAWVLEPPELRAAVVTSLQSLASPAAGPPVAEAAAVTANVATAARRQRPEDSGARLARLLALVPWLRQHPGVTYAEAASHFGITERRLRDDLMLAVCTEFGPHLLTLDIEAFSNRIVVRDPRGVSAPMRFSVTEAVSLLVSLRLLAQVPGIRDRDALDGAIAKLEAAAGDAAAAAARVEIAAAPAADEGPDPAIASLIGQAASSRRALRIRYLGIGRDQITDRVVDPMRVVHVEGRDYLEGWCRLAGAVRLFRFDRVLSAELTGEPAAVPEAAAALEFGGGRIHPEGELVTLLASPPAAWLADQLPVERVTDLPDGSRLLELAAGSRTWLIRLVLGLRGQVQVIAPREAIDDVRTAAEAALRRYQT